MRQRRVVCCTNCLSLTLKKCIKYNMRVEETGTGLDLCQISLIFFGGMKFLGSYLDVAMFLAAGAGFVVVSMGINYLLSPRNPYPAKLVTYECGESPVGDARVNFHIRFYIFALTFFVFDMEAVFLYPWAVVFKSLGLFALVQMLIFLGILAIGLLYAYKKKVLQWV